MSTCEEKGALQIIHLKTGGFGSGLVWFDVGVDMVADVGVDIGVDVGVDVGADVGADVGSWVVADEEDAQ